VGLVPPEVDQVPLIEWDGVPPSAPNGFLSVFSFSSLARGWWLINHHPLASALFYMNIAPVRGWGYTAFHPLTGEEKQLFLEAY